MKKIELPNGKFTLVNDEDFEYLNNWKWKQHPKGAIMRSKYVKGKYKSIYMHREIMKAPNEKQVDHVNGDRLDNRRSNLRLCNNSENTANRRGFNKLGVKGVVKNGNKFFARIVFNKKHIYLGTFLNIKEAAKAYNEAAIKYFGQFAKLNQL